jgi:hypothetical protein
MDAVRSLLDVNVIAVNVRKESIMREDFIDNRGGM